MEALRYQGAEVVAEELEALRQRIIANMDAAGQRASGATANSLTPEVTEGSAGITGILWGRSFFSTLEKGSSPWEKAVHSAAEVLHRSDGRMGCEKGYLRAGRRYCVQHYDERIEAISHRWPDRYLFKRDSRDD